MYPSMDQQAGGFGFSVPPTGMPPPQATPPQGSPQPPNQAPPESSPPPQAPSEGAPPAQAPPQAPHQLPPPQALLQAYPQDSAQGASENDPQEAAHEAPEEPHVPPPPWLPAPELQASLPPSMSALTFQGKQAIAFKEVPTPKLLHPGDAIVRVSLCAICGSDLHPYHERETGIAADTVVGHEFVGTIAVKGPYVTKMEVGDRVMSPFTASCGQCYFCLSGLTCRCSHRHARLFGWVDKSELEIPEYERCGLHGSQAQFVRVPLADTTLVKMPEELTDEQGILLGDILSTGFFCAESGGVGPGTVVVVIGCGPVGLMAIVAAKHLGAMKVLAIDSIPARLEMAKSLGAIPLNLESQDLMGVVKWHTDGRGTDVALEVVGNNSALRLAFDLIMPMGTISSVGVHTAPSFPFTPSEGYDKNVTYRSGRCPARYMMERITPLLQAGHLSDATRIITHRRALSEGVQAYTDFDQKNDGMIKCLLNPWA